MELCQTHKYYHKKCMLYLSEKLSPMETSLSYILPTAIARLGCGLLDSKFYVHNDAL